jgi:hypothetical protein
MRGKSQALGSGEDGLAKILADKQKEGTAAK